MRNIMTELREDLELKRLREQWDNDVMPEKFPPFNWDEYMGLDDYKDVIKWWLDHPEWKPQIDAEGCIVRPPELVEYTRAARNARAGKQHGRFQEDL